jgi:hypothetical protein
MAKAEVKYNVIVAETGVVVFDDCTFEEAIQLREKLIESDQSDGIYKIGYYGIKRIKQV